jgi:hypothetical protein
MEFNYTLYQDEEERKKEDYKALKTENNNKKFYISFFLVVAFFIIFYCFNVNKTNSIEKINKNDQIIAFINKMNKTTGSPSNRKSWNIDKYINIFKFLSKYDDYIENCANFTNKVKEFFNLNITTDIFDLNNYIKIKDYLGLDFTLENTIENGLFILYIIDGDAVMDFIFDRKYFSRLRKYKKFFSWRFFIFIMLSLITYFGQSNSYELIKQYIAECYNALRYGDSLDNNNQTLILK